MVASVLMTSANEYQGKDCFSCYGATDGKWCLNKGSFDSGTCCKGTCPEQEDDRFCISKSTITNSAIGRFACPLNKENCPSSDIEIKLTKADEWVERKYRWDREMPAAEASDWNCKYTI